MLVYPIPTTIEGSLLGIRDPNLEHQTKADKAIMWACLGAAKLTVAAAWKRRATPEISLWHARLWRILSMQHLADIFRDEYKNFEYKWGPLVTSVPRLALSYVPSLSQDSASLSILITPFNADWRSCHSGQGCDLILAAPPSR